VSRKCHGSVTILPYRSRDRASVWARGSALGDRAIECVVWARGSALGDRAIECVVWARGSALGDRAIECVVFNRIPWAIGIVSRCVRVYLYL